MEPKLRLTFILTEAEPSGGVTVLWDGIHIASIDGPDESMGDDPNNPSLYIELLSRPPRHTLTAKVNPLSNVVDVHFREKKGGPETGDGTEVSGE